jgi:hypothetical protein
MTQQSDVLQAYLTRFEPEPENKEEEETPEEEEE